MTEEYRTGKIHSIRNLMVEGKDRWEMVIDTGTELKPSQHAGFYARTFKVGEPVIYAYCVEYKNVCKVFQEDYFVMVKDHIEAYVLSAEDKRIRRSKGKKRRKLEIKLKEAEFLVNRLKAKLEGLK